MPKSSVFGLATVQVAASVIVTVKVDVAVAASGSSTHCSRQALARMPVRTSRRFRKNSVRMMFPHP